MLNRTPRFISQSLILDGYVRCNDGQASDTIEVATWPAVDAD